MLLQFSPSTRKDTIDFLLTRVSGDGVPRWDPGPDGSVGDKSSWETHRINDFVTSVPELSTILFQP